MCPKAAPHGFQHMNSYHGTSPSLWYSPYRVIVKGRDTPNQPLIAHYSRRRPLRAPLAAGASQVVPGIHALRELLGMRVKPRTPKNVQTLLNFKDFL
jgi:hypothetical protein